MIVSALDGMLAALSVGVEAFAVCQITADSEISISRLDKIEVHYVLAGTLHLMIEGNEALVLEAGTIAVVPAGRRQRMAGSRNATRSLAPEQICSVRTDGLMLFTSDDGATAVRVMCGKTQADLSGSCSLFDGLSTPIVADLSDEAVVRACFTAMLCKVAKAALLRALTASLMMGCLALLVRHINITAGCGSRAVGRHSGTTYIRSSPNAGSCSCRCPGTTCSDLLQALPLIQTDPRRGTPNLPIALKNHRLRHFRLTLAALTHPSDPRTNRTERPWRFSFRRRCIADSDQGANALLGDTVSLKAHRCVGKHIYGRRRAVQTAAVVEYLEFLSSTRITFGERVSSSSYGLVGVFEMISA